MRDLRRTRTLARLFLIVRRFDHDMGIGAAHAKSADAGNSSLRVLASR